MSDLGCANPLEHSLSYRVRTYELDENGHVNNAVYLQWAENLTAEHAERCGFGRGWSQRQGGAWLVRRHQITFHQPAQPGDEVHATVRVLTLGGVRGERRTTFQRATDEVLLAEVWSEWVWVRSSDGRPARVPDDLLRLYRPALDDARDASRASR
jgi:acyl-CoA thioester hydrolase